MSVIIPPVGPPSGPNWTYTQDPGGSTLDAIRWLIQDTDEAHPLILDSEVLFAASIEENIFMAAALCCDTIATQFSRLAQSESNGDVSRSYGDRGRAYADRAAELRARAKRGSGAPIAYAGGLSRADMDTLALDEDAVQPYFTAGMNDHSGEGVRVGYGIDQIG